MTGSEITIRRGKFYEDREGVSRSFIDEHQAPVAKRRGGCSGTLIGDGRLLMVAHCGSNEWWFDYPLDGSTGQ